MSDHYADQWDKYRHASPEAVHNTIEFLRVRIRARDAGYPVCFTTDPAWLVNMAINRRAGWPDDPGLTYGSCMPVDGKYPKKADGDFQRHLRLIAHEVNTPKLIVRESSLGECRKLVLSRIPHRITRNGEDL